MSTRLVEDPVRRSRMLSGWKAFAFALGSILLSGAFLLVLSERTRTSTTAQRDPAALAVLARQDLPPIYANECHAPIKSTELFPCTYGDPEAKRRLLLTGDSHAAQWMPALDVLTKRHSYQLISWTKSGCTVADIVPKAQGKTYEECIKWRQTLIEKIVNDPPDVIIVSGSRGTKSVGLGSGTEQLAALSGGYQRTLQIFAKTGAQIVVIADTPSIRDIPKCLGSKRGSISSCAGRVRKGRSKDPLAEHASKQGWATIDMNDVLCPGGTCPVLHDGTLIWRDKHHVTATFSIQIAPVLDDKLPDEFWEKTGR